jgi:alpha-1,6-mannosyltransferase
MTSVADALTIDGPRATGRVAPARLARWVAPTVALAAVLLPLGWLVLAAADRGSVLSPPAARAGAGGAWSLGPLHGLLNGVARAPHLLHSELLVVLGLVGAGWLLAWTMAPRLPVRVLWGAVGAAHGLLFLGPPLPLTDVFNYQLYGRMAAVHGLNPYRDVPAQAAHDPIFALTNWHHLRSPYGPLFTLASEALGVFGVHGWLWAWKAVVILSSLATIALAADIAGRLGGSRQRVIAAVGLSPLLLIAEVGGLHQDMPAMACLLGAAWCLVRTREGGGAAWMSPLAGALVVAAAGIKPSFAMVVGVVVLGASHRPRAIAGAAAAAAALVVLDLLVYGGALPAIASQSALVNPLSVPNLLGLAAGHGGADHAVRLVADGALVAIAAGATIAVGVRRELALGALGVVLFGSLLTLAWVMPWYLIWALPFIALARPRALVALVVVATCWLTIGGLPTLPGILHAGGYYPTRLATGRANHLEFRRLVR